MSVTLPRPATIAGMCRASKRFQLPDLTPNLISLLRHSRHSKTLRFTSSELDFCRFLRDFVTIIVFEISCTGYR